MDYVVVCAAAMIAAGLTFFSGFGLGTILMPAFAFFFEPAVAVAATAVVHLANNLFKLALVGKHADRRILLRFALPAIGAAFLGAWLLSVASGLAPLATYDLRGHTCEVTWVGVTIAAIMLAFAAMELMPSFDRWAFDAKWLPVGGVVSGFFGGLSGHQGALRSAFLVRCGLTKEAFIGTGVAAAVIVDLARLAVYGAESMRGHFSSATHDRWWLVAAGCVAAFIGSYAGSKLVKKVTLRTVRVIVGVMLMALGVLIGAGVLG
jgi:uncharacterized membrane protein YfcA